MRSFFIPALALAIASCERRNETSAAPAEPATAAVEVAPKEEILIPKADMKTSVVRINSTLQSWNPGQPWEKSPPSQRRALAAIVGQGQVLTTAEMVADATFLEFESPDGTRFARARILAVDYEVNLALLAAESEDEAKTFFAGTTSFEIAAPPHIGDTLGIMQVEDNGQSLLTPGALQSVDVSSNFLDGHSFLTFMVKASMQSAASSYSLPVLKEGKLAGILLSYNGKDQICDVASTDIVARFLSDAASGNYKGFPSLGISVARTEDPSFRQWLKLAPDQGGIYVGKVRKGGAADLAGVKQGDVLLAVDGQAINRRGFYEHPNYGSVFWGHLVRGLKFTGESVRLSLLRDGSPLDVEAKMTREEENQKLVPGYTFGKAPNYLVKGGLLFQELSRTLLEAFGEDWTSRAPLPFLDALENPEKSEGKVDRIIFLSGAIPTPATVGYESLRNLIVRKVNGREIRNMKSLIEAFDSPQNGLHSIEFDDDGFTIQIDDQVATAVDTQLLKRGIPRLSRTD